MFQQLGRKSRDKTTACQELVVSGKIPRQHTCHILLLYLYFPLRPKLDHLVSFLHYKPAELCPFLIMLPCHWTSWDEAGGSGFLFVLLFIWHCSIHWKNTITLLCVNSCLFMLPSLAILSVLIHKWLCDTDESTIRISYIVNTALIKHQSLEKQTAGFQVQSILILLSGKLSQSLTCDTLKLPLETHNPGKWHPPYKLK